MQNSLARCPGHGLLATTHLVLKKGSGDKYSFARQWDIPAVQDRSVSLWCRTGQFGCGAGQVSLIVVQDRSVFTGQVAVGLLWCTCMTVFSILYLYHVHDSFVDCLLLAWDIHHVITAWPEILAGNLMAVWQMSGLSAKF